MFRSMVMSSCLGTAFNSVQRRGVKFTSNALQAIHRTQRCGEVSLADVGKRVRLAGWLEYKRGNKFFTLRDATGNCQILSDLDVQLPTKESVVSVEGIVQSRPDKDINRNMATGYIELLCTNIEILSKCKHHPFPLSDFSQSKEEVRMRYRYIDLRSKMMQYNLRLRSSFILKLRKYLCEENNFVDVETPCLFRKTPGGAQEFVVPTQKPGLFYSLPQSPQQFKQLLMVGGIDRYMQIAKCFRDEGAKPDRQPEFTQLDLELSFSSQLEIQDLVEGMIVKCWPEELSFLSTPFPRMSYSDAIEQYGVDKPDTRFESVITDVTDKLSRIEIFQPSDGDDMTVKAVKIESGCERLTSTQIKLVQKEVESQYRLNICVVKIEENGVWKTPISKYLDRDHYLSSKVNEKLDAAPNDLLFICAQRSPRSACEALGKCRTLASSYCENNNKPLYDNTKRLFNFLWVVDFPLFERDHSRYHSAHHPFTAPVEGDLKLLYSDPSKVRGQHYDLVLNGSEVGGGSIRIHDADTQRYIFETILQEETTQLNHLFQALDSGCPPHGGIALGLDRLLAIMCNAPSIRDVIAFPKSSEGADLLTTAPCPLTQADLDLYNISVSQDKLT